MEERFTDTAWTEGDFNKATTSASQTSLQLFIWFIKYHLSSHLKFKSERPSISFKAGTFIHEWFQNILVGQAKIEDVEHHFKNHIDQFKFSENEGIKAQFILKYVKSYVEKHLEAINEVSDNFSGWKIEHPFSDWYDDKYMDQTLNIASEGYIAGLFDGEGSVYFKQTKQIRHNRKGKPVHNVLVIRMEIAMTDEHVIRWVHDVLGVGAVGPRKVRPGRKKQWRWRCSHRDAYFVAMALYEYSRIKTNKLQQIIDHNRS
jgi:hypothetical protein